VIAFILGLRIASLRGTTLIDLGKWFRHTKYGVKKLA
jgi:hypothetical protein